AIANIAAARLLERDSHPALICYTFESPATTENTDAHNAKYGSIFNYLCDDDPVTMLPIWGMTRYGEEIVYNTADIEDVIEAAAELNPDTREYNRNYLDSMSGGGVKALLDEIVDTLEETVPTRGDYTKPQTITIPTDEPFVYTYQGGLQALCHVIFGSSSGIGSLTGPLADNLDVLLSGLTYAKVEEAYADQLGETEEAAEIRADSESRFLALAELLYSAVKEAEPSLDVKLPDVYGLLKLLAPQLVNVDAVGEDDMTLPDYEDFSFYDYFDYVMLDSIVNNSSALVFSHQPDMILARLKLRAPAPEVEEVNLTITPPEAGQAVSLAAEEAKDSADALGYTWLSVTEAKWETEDTALSDGMVHYLTVTLRLIGHTVPDSFRFMINEEEAKITEILRQNGEVLVTGTWEFTLGEPEQVTVRFDAGDPCESPEPIQVDRGVRLEYAGLTLPDLSVVEDETVCWHWKFCGWTDPDGGSWEDVVAEQDVTLRAVWIRLIDKVEVTYDIPHLGDGEGDLFRLSAPEGVPYELREFSLSYWDEEEDIYISHYYDPEEEEDFVLDQEGEWKVAFKAYANEPDVDFCFKTVIKVVVFDGEEYSFDVDMFDGVLTVNGEDIDEVSYIEGYYDSYSEETILSAVDAEYRFIPLINEEPAEESAEEPIDEPDEEPAEPEIPWIPGPFPPVPVPFLPAPLRPVYPAAPTEPAVPEREPDVSEPSVPVQKPVFADVPADAYYADAVAWAVENRITSGTDAAHFSPDAFCSRAEMVTFLWRAAGSPVPSIRTNPFADVPENAYYTDAVLWAYEAGITKGTDSAHFSPGEPVTRGQGITMLFRMMNGTAEGGNPFLDVADDAYYGPAVRWAVTNGVAKGVTQTLFAPDDTCTRAQIVTFLYRAAKGE
ncbi:MAG: S-layer homology domain-containing protein, partial [Clostridia bacterium]|nr:S-layer homology domain-containing protein [Clostridia bacterium]